MALGVLINSKSPRGRLRALLPWSWLGLALTSASCTPISTVAAPEMHMASLPPAILLDQAVTPADQASVLPVPVEADALPGEGLASVGGLQQAAASFVFRGRTPLDQLRSHDCLAQAVYYEAASESEDGQRAVAQVVLNRVRHPSWPNSVCGVVYQGPMRPGGGCQFTFTCDGSLARRPSGVAWARARAIAAEALAGQTYAGVGLSTHYHTHAVSPAWAPRLERTAIIGAHRFYRLPGSWGQAGAFAAAYSGSEPLPRPSMLLPRRASAGTGLASFVPTALNAATASTASGFAGDPQPEAEDPPPSTVREEYRNSGQWRDDAPAALTRR